MNSSKNFCNFLSIKCHIRWQKWLNILSANVLRKYNCFLIQKKLKRLQSFVETDRQFKGCHLSILHHLKLCNGTSLVREPWTDFTALLIHINLERKKKTGEKGFSHLASLAITHFTWIEQYSEQSFLIGEYANDSIWHFPLSCISQRWCSLKFFSPGAKTVKSLYFW